MTLVLLLSRRRAERGGGGLQAGRQGGGALRPGRQHHHRVREAAGRASLWQPGQPYGCCGVTDIGLTARRALRSGQAVADCSCCSRWAVGPLRCPCSFRRACAKVFKGKNIEKGIANPTCVSSNKWVLPLLHPSPPSCTGCLCALGTRRSRLCRTGACWAWFASPASRQSPFRRSRSDGVIVICRTCLLIAPAIPHLILRLTWPRAPPCSCVGGFSPLSEDATELKEGDVTKM